MKKRVLAAGVITLLLLTLAGCSNPKRDALDTNIQKQMNMGTLNAED